MSVWAELLYMKQFQVFGYVDKCLTKFFFIWHIQIAYVWSKSPREKLLGSKVH